MKRITLILAILFMAAGLRAQTAATPAIPPVQLFTLSANVAGFNSPSATNGAMIATAAIQILPSVSVGYEHIGITSINSRYELGVIAYTRTLNTLLGKTISDKLLFDASQIGITFSAGAGKLLQPTANRIAETAGVHISYPLSDHISYQIVGIDVLHGGVQTGFLTSSTTEALSTGINLHF